MSKALILRVLFVLAVIALGAFALSKARAQALPVHPFIGMANVCVAARGEQPACQVLRSNDDYSTKAECEADMVRRLNTLANLIHRDHADWDVTAQYACVPDDGQYNG